MNEPERPKKFFGEQVPPWYFWALLALACLTLALGWSGWVWCALLGLTLGVYYNWANRSAESRRIKYSDEVLKKAGIRRSKH